MFRKIQNWKKTWVALAMSVAFGLVLGVGFSWVPEIQAQKSGTDWIFGGTTPASFADLAREVKDAVVNISTTKNLRRGPYYQLNRDYFRRHFRQNPGGAKRPNSLGSGFILDSDGYILTNAHVIRGADEILVKLADGRTFNARIIGMDEKSDIAVIKVNAKGSLPTVRLGNSDQLRVGDWVVAIGNPFGLTQTVTSGILSAKGRVIGAGPYDNFLQTDASINPGNSGGPLFNLQGEVVGVNTAIIAGGTGIGFAIPINMAKTIIPQLLKQGKVQRGYLGIGLHEVTTELAKSLGLSKPEGVLVSAVYEGTPAHRAGIRAGDLIMKFDQKPIERSQDLPIYVSQSTVGSVHEVELLRDGKRKQLQVKLGSLDKANQAALNPSGTGGEAMGNSLGVAVRDITPQERRHFGISAGEGVAVIRVQPGSPADSVGLQPGDVILEINNDEISGSKDFQKTTRKLRRGQIVRLFVRRGPLASYFAFAL